MSKEQRTIQQEVDRRARLADLPADAIYDMVKADVESKRFRVTYELLNQLQILSIVEFTDADATWVTFNVGHPFVSEFMLGKSVTPTTRAQMEIVLMVIHGVGESVDAGPVMRTFWARESAEWAKRLWTATEILTKPGKDGMNMLGDYPGDGDDPDDPDFLAEPDEVEAFLDDTRERT